MSAHDLSELSMLDLFRLDAADQIQALTAGLLVLERNATSAEHLGACMRAAHSLKGAARVAGIGAVVHVAHAMEDCFVAVQRGAVALRRADIDVLLQAVDLLHRIADTPDAAMARWSGAGQAEVDGVLTALIAVLAERGESDDAPAIETRQSAVPEEYADGGRMLRVTAENLNRMLGLAGESMVESRWLKPFAELLLRLKRLHDAADKALDGLHEALPGDGQSADCDAAFGEVRGRIHECRQQLAQRLLDLEMFDSRSTNLAHRLYESALACRMRPFGDGVKQFPRLVRDLGRSLNKEVRLEIGGEGVQVDRDILEKLDAPLGHLLRNAVDHGVESAQDRRAAGKAAEGVVRLEARHSAGLLHVSVADDGRGVDLHALRAAIVERRLASPQIAGKLEEAELLEFLFLPGFTTTKTVTEVSGRGVGLDAVQDMIKQAHGKIRIFAQSGKGTRIQLQLPLTLSVVRTLLVEIGGEPYAFPLVHIARTLMVPRADVRMLEGREHFTFDGRALGLISAQQIFGGPAPQPTGGELAVIVIGDAASPYGVVTDRFLGERELVVQPLDPRLGKIKDIAAAALMEDGSPVLIVDIEDMLHSVDKLVAAGRLHKVDRAGDADDAKRRKRVLVVEDSLTVRELERKLLEHAGYDIEIAVDGMDGWNAVRSGHFNLVITDIDMPRMDGIELLTLIKKDPNLKSMPVLVVSYKDREVDRQRGLDAGADYYVTKGSFEDDTLLRAVVDLIGEADL